MWSLNKFGSRTAFITESGHHISYAQLQSDIEQLNGFIDSRCLVFCLCDLEYGSVMGYVSFIEYGIVPVLLDAKLDQQLLWNLVELYKPDYIWMPETLRDRIGVEPGFKAIANMERFSLIKTPFHREYSLHEELALLLTTSGSTGSPKFVKQSYENIRSNTQAIIQYLSIDEQERAITTLPMNYTYGLSIINTHLYVGASIILTEKKLMQKAFWQQLKEYKATSLAGVPYTYEMLNKLRFFSMNLPNLRTLTQAGGKLPVDLHRKFAEYAQKEGKRFFVMYGATEATARMGYLPWEKAVEKCGSIGIAIPDGEFFLLDADGKEIDSSNQAGELVYKGANVTLGYAQCGEDLGNGSQWHGIYKTGDIAKRDQEGFYYITGRKKRFLKMFGNRVSLDEIEQLVKTNFNRTDCACIGVDNHMTLFVTEQGNTRNIKRFIAEKTGINPTAIRVKQIDQVPKNDSGKIMYIVLERDYD